MLKVTNGTVTITVTNGAFKAFYEPIGFCPVDDGDGREDTGVGNYHPSSGERRSGDSSQQETEQSLEDEEDEEDCDEDEVDLSEIPLGEMSFDQLNEYADQLELEHDGIRSKKELRVLIREHLNK